MSISVDSRKKLRNMLVNDEGFRGTPYTDSKGYLTIGFGFNLTTQELPLSIALEWLDLLLFTIEHQLEKHVTFFDKLNDARKSVLMNMAYQMGIGGLLSFHDMLKALELKDYAATVAAMKDSVWYREFTARASRLTKIMLSGEF